MNPNTSIHRAGYVVPVNQPVIPNGAVVVKCDKVLACGPFAELGRDFPQAQIIDHGSGALLPGLVNAHIHLELSHLEELAKHPFIGSFPGWILQLIQLRDRLGAETHEARKAALETLHDQYKDGIAVLLDIGNTEIAQKLAGESEVHLLPYREHLGFTASRLQKNLEYLSKQAVQTYCSAHALYSTHIDLVLALKNRANILGHVFPIHCAESKAELDMFREGNGEMVAFLQQRGFWDDSFLSRVKGIQSPVAFLAANGVLDPGTLCVHCVQLDDDDIILLARAGAQVCLCPGSNQFLEVGQAPVEKILQAGILPALGTDSLASNPEISLWREMALLAAEHPLIPASTIFAMATLGGAQALGLGHEYGCIANGQKAHQLYVELPGSVNSDEELYQYLVHAQGDIHLEHMSERGL
ncbi:amidohydrolase family protein [Desulfogranum japonicum]|uniref:amidohydrolase family protein n=1 Tax=Desulfogranum japonicum TaxID=231447 RepID=UPI0004907BB4|nr:amidohydrolase family protein [Desulfogranum japonicum]